MYRIKSLRGAIPQPGTLYLLDANVWHFILTSPYDLAPYEQVYINFFDRLLDAGANPDNPPLIYLNGLIVSEVFNSFMRSKWDAYCDDLNQDISYKDYRVTSDFRSNAEAVISDFNDYSHSFLVESDLVFNPFDILSEFPAHSDYNDFYYYKLAVQKDMTIVTNDKDFDFHDVKILTNNERLLRVATR